MLARSQNIKARPGCRYLPEQAMSPSQSTRLAYMSRCVICCSSSGSLPMSARMINRGFIGITALFSNGAVVSRSELANR